MSKIEQIKAIAAQLRELYPGKTVILEVDQTGGIDFTYHGTRTYAEATEFFRELGIQRREKKVYDTYTALNGTVDNVLVRTYPDELPPSCRKVKKIERIPKLETKETGEFIEIEREVIECGPEVTEVAS